MSAVSVRRYLYVSVVVACLSIDAADAQELIPRAYRPAPYGTQVLAVTYQNSGSDQFLFADLSTLKPEMIEDATKNTRELAGKLRRIRAVKSARSNRPGRGSLRSLTGIQPRHTIKKIRVVSTIEYYLSD